MTNTEAIVYGMLMNASNLEKLVGGGLPEIVIDDLWFKCVACANVQHSDGMVLLGVSLDPTGSLEQTVPVQSVRSFFHATDDDIGGLHPKVAACGSVVLRCVECASKLWNFELDIPAGETPEGMRHQ